MQEKIQKSLKHPIIQQLKDVRVLGFIVFGVLVLLVSWSGVNIIQTNYGLQKQISKLEQQNEIQKLENNNLKLTNEYYNTDTYLDLTARRQFGKAAPGEKVLLMPKSVALAHTVADNVKKVKAPVVEKPLYQRNFEAWVNFFLHRTTVEE